MKRGWSFRASGLLTISGIFSPRSPSFHIYILRRATTTTTLNLITYEGGDSGCLPLSQTSKRSSSPPRKINFLPCRAFTITRRVAYLNRANSSSKNPQTKLIYLQIYAKICCRYAPFLFK